MALNMYLKIGGIEGESTDQAHEGWIDVLSVSQSVTQPASALASSGRRTSQRVIMQDFSVVKTIDKATPKLYLACCSGQRIPTVEIHLVTTGALQPYMIYKMENAIISSFDVSGGSGGDAPTETLSLNFSKISWEYVKFDPDGRASAPEKAEWDLETNTGA